MKRSLRLVLLAFLVCLSLFPQVKAQALGVEPFVQKEKFKPKLLIQDEDTLNEETT